MSWLEEIYQVVRAAYLDDGGGRGPSASNLPFTLPPSAGITTNIEASSPKPPTEQLIDESIRNYKNEYMAPYRRQARNIEAWTGALMQMPAWMLRSQMKQNVGKMVAPQKQAMKQIAKTTENQALRAEITKGNLEDLYDLTGKPEYAARADRAAQIEADLWKQTRQQQQSVKDIVTGARETSRALDRIPQEALDNIKTFGLGTNLFASTASSEDVQISPLHIDETLPFVVTHEIIHTDQRGAVIGKLPVNEEGIELFKRLRAADIKTRLIDQHLSIDAGDFGVNPAYEDLATGIKTPLIFAQNFSVGTGYKNNPMELHANLMGKAVTEGHITKENYAEKFMATMQGALERTEADVNQMFELMAERNPIMRSQLQLLENELSGDYSYMIKHDDPTVAKAIQAIQRGVSQGKGTFGDMVYFSGQGKYVQTKMGPEGKLQHMQYEDIWGEGPPTYLETDPKGNALGEPPGMSVTSDPYTAARFRRRNAPRENKLPHMQTRQIEAALKAETDPAMLALYKEEYKRRTDPRQIARVKLNLGGDADKALLKTFTKKGQKDLLDTYSEAMVEELAKVYKAKKSLAKDALDLISQRNTQYELYDAVEKTIKLNVFGVQDFNFNHMKKMQDLGYKGIAHSPNRYGEWEIRMFEPEDVYAKDVRRWHETAAFEEGNDPAITRMMESGQKWRMNAWEEEARAFDQKQWESGSMRAIYKQVDLQDVIYRAIKRAYGQETN